MSCMSGNCCPCDWNQFDKVCCHGVAIAMTVASCYVSIFSGNGRWFPLWDLVGLTWITHRVRTLFTDSVPFHQFINSSLRNGDIWMACAFFFWFALAAYTFEIIIEHDLFGNCGFRGGSSSGGGSSSNTNNNNSSSNTRKDKKKDKNNKVNDSKA